MAIYHPFSVQCNCGNSFVAHLAKSVNAARSPEIRQKIIDGDFHKTTCPKCSVKFAVDKEFSYTDLRSNLFIKVKPVDQRHTWLNASAALSEEIALVPDELKSKGNARYRVVFGLAELREKIIAHLNDIDDRHVELAKVLLMYEHPVLMRKARLRIVLDEVKKNELEFFAHYDHSKDVFKIKMPRSVLNNMVDNEPAIRDWVKKNHSVGNIFELKDDHWINIWRWSPQMQALSFLKKTIASLSKTGDVDVDTKEFDNMLKYLPRGSHLPSWAKKDLRTLFLFAKKNGHKKLEDTLFELRFDKALDDDWAYNNKPDDIDTIWQLLQDLPDTNVEGNTSLTSIDLTKGGGGTYGDNIIAMGAADIGDESYFQHTMRHEVGHAVHEKNEKKINDWLKKRFGWELFDPTVKGINIWVQMMGGYGTDDTKAQGQIRHCLTEVLGKEGSWFPAKLSKLPAKHPWNAKGCVPRVVFTKSQKDEEWFKNYKRWHVYNGKAFFFNYYYTKLCVINADTLLFVKNMPSNYAVMSHFEFFAELYAVYYNPKHPLRKKIPKDVCDWLNKNIGVPES